MSRLSAVVCLFVSLWSSQGNAQEPAIATPLRLAPIFGDHMILPPDTAVTVRGWGPAAAQVSVTPTWGPPVRTTIAGAGRWQAKIQTPGRGEQASLLIQCGAAKVHVRDILMGDVWLASGQSNMEMSIGKGGGVHNWEQVVRDANYPGLRVFTATRQARDRPASEIEGEWQVCTPDVAASFSAAAYFFARDLIEANKGPIGLVVSSWGGTRCEAWTSGAGLAGFPEFAKQLAAQQDGNSEQEQALRRRAFFAAAAKARPVAAAVEVTVPDLWSKAALKDFDGVADYTRAVALPANFRGKQLRLELGAIDDMDTVIWNGTRIAGSERDGVWSTPRNYAVAAKHTNVESVDLLVRVFDTGGEGGFTSAPETLRLVIADDSAAQSAAESGIESVPLAGTWQRTVRAEMKELPAWPRSSGGANRPAVLWNGMIEPLLPFPFTGCIWYQGESNRTRASQYRELFPAMIRDWRRAFGRDVPFYFVQIAPYGYKGDTGQCAQLRAAQAVALDLPHTGMVVTLDCGNARDIHPKAKQPVGARLALLARAQHYGDPVACSGPRAIAATNQGAVVHVQFAAGTGEPMLMNAGVGFELAGADGKFHAASAIVEQGQLELSCDDVGQPTTVRYAWHAAPAWSLVNAAGLPGAPFELPIR